MIWRSDSILFYSLTLQSKMSSAERPRGLGFENVRCSRQSNREMLCESLKSFLTSSLLEGKAWRVCSPPARRRSGGLRAGGGRGAGSGLGGPQRRARARARPFRHCDGGCRVSAPARASARPHRIARVVRHPAREHRANTPSASREPRPPRWRVRPTNAPARADRTRSARAPLVVALWNDSRAGDCGAM